MIEIKNASKIYTIGKNEIFGIKDINLSIVQGEFVAIIGPSGCGKSTLLNLIGGIDTPTKGSVVIGGIDLTNLNDKELTIYRKNKVGFVFQFFNLISTLTASENVELSLNLRGIKGKAARQEAKHYLDIVGMAELKDRFPSELSGGQQQRTAIARALAKKATILLADEPTGNIDSTSGQEVISSLYHSSKKLGTTTMMVTHDLSITKMADRIISLKDGKIINDARNNN